jgi:hypothetical protein
LLDYYATPDVRELCHKAKQGDPVALNVIAETLSTRIGSSDTIVPTPNRNGEAGVVGDICRRISYITNCNIWDGLVGNKRESIYDAKKRGRPLTGEALGFALKTPPPSTALTIIDTIEDTGTTLDAALSLLPNAQSLTFAFVDKEVERTANNQYHISEHSQPLPALKMLTQIPNESVAFHFIRLVMRDLDKGHDAFLESCRSIYTQPKHAGLKTGLRGGFKAEFKLSPYTRDISWYHGSKHEFTHFDPDKMRNGDYQKGVYVTPSVYLANAYSQKGFVYEVKLKTPPLFMHEKIKALSELGTNATNEQRRKILDAPVIHHDDRGVRGIIGVVKNIDDISELHRINDPHILKELSKPKP